MANKTLKSIKFPDLADTYVIPQVDSTLAISGRPADSKSTGDALALKADASALSDYAKTDGLYEDMTVGNAEQLVASVFEEDSTPYLFRTSGGSVDIGDREYVNGIVGGTVGWNQLVQISKIDATKTSHAVTCTNNGDGTISLSGTADADSSIDLAKYPSVANHIYYVPTPNANIRAYNGYSADGYNIFKHRATSTAYTLYYSVTNGVNYSGVKLYVNVFDLTQMFGSTIADYIYSLEQGTAGAGVAKLKSWGFFDKPYYAYNAGELKSVSGLVSHDMTGFNQWDEEWEVGLISASDGQNTVNNSYSRTKNYVRVLPLATYYFKNTPSPIYLRRYDASKNYLGYGQINGNGTWDAPSDTYYIRFCWDGTTYNNDICINLSWDGSRDGEYEPYELHSYPLDSDLTLRGIPKLDANNSLYYDGDVYEADGTVTRKYGIVDLGTLDYSFDSGLFINYKSAGIDIGSKARGGDFVCTKYLNSGRTSSESMADKTLQLFGSSDNANLWIKDTSYTDAQTFKTAMSGVYLVYELATPTTETADPYQTPQIVNDFGTEEFVLNNSIVPVGHETKYQANLVAKLEMMPNSPSGNGDYIVRQTSGENSYVAITDNSVIDGLLTRCPAASGEDGTYVLKATISDDTVTYAWVAE